MAQPARNFEQPDERAARLFELGLEERTLEEAVIRGLSERQTRTPLHPASYPGTTQWAETIAALRMLLIPSGWSPSEVRNYPRVISPNARIAIAVATGELETGEPGPLGPRIKHPKGAETRNAVETNYQQLNLFQEDDPEPIADLVEPLLQTWILMLATDAHQLSYELSLPLSLGADGRIVSWAERIIFPAIEISEIPGRDRSDEDDDEGGAGDIDVPIERI